MGTHKKNKIKFNKEDLEIAVKNSKTYVEVFRFLKLCPTNYGFLKKKLDEYNISVSHFISTSDRGKLYRSNKVKHNLKDLLVKDFPYPFSMGNIKSKLFKEGLKNNICEKCGQGEIWRGDKISLILDHINGDRYDNRIENLRIICPNCNAALETHCGKNKKGNINLQKEIETASKINQNKIKLESIKNKILNSNIDFTKHGWRIHLGKFMDLSPQHCGKYIKKHLPEIWEKCAKHKN